jgi:hypothetical protein
VSTGAPQNEKLLSARKLVVQLFGFLVGVALLGWCISIAVAGGDWSKIAHANPLLVGGLVLCTLTSFFANGVMFWLVIRPIQNVGFWNMQWLNFVTGILNYAPIRAGLIARVAYHLRVDRMSLLRVGAWLAALAYTLALTLGACIAATIVWPHLDVVWIAIVVGQLLLGGLLTWAIMGHPLVVRFGRGMDQMLSVPSCLWGAIGLRLIDIAAFVGRMACAAAILDLNLPATDVFVLGFAALALSLNPLGRTGFREMAVAFVASRLVTGDLSSTEVDSSMAQLALIESAGEALVAIPVGAVCLWWYRQRWRQAGARPPVSQDDD